MGSRVTVAGRTRRGPGVAPQSPTYPPRASRFTCLGGRDSRRVGEPHIGGVSQSFRGEAHFLPGWLLPTSGPDSGLDGRCSDGAWAAPGTQGSGAASLGGSLGAQAVRHVFGSTSPASEHPASGHRVPAGKAPAGRCGVWRGREGFRLPAAVATGSRGFCHQGFLTSELLLFGLRSVCRGGHLGTVGCGPRPASTGDMTGTLPGVAAGGGGTSGPRWLPAVSAQRPGVGAGFPLEGHWGSRKGSRKHAETLLVQGQWLPSCLRPTGRGGRPCHQDAAPPPGQTESHADTFLSWE